MADQIEENDEPPVFDDEASNSEDDDVLADDDEEDFGDEEEEGPVVRAEIDDLFRRISTKSIPLRVHDVLIKGNRKTRESLIEYEIEALKSVTSVQELLQAAAVTNARLRRLGIFDSVNITLDAGPPELPGTSNVVIEVVETKTPIAGDFGVFSKPEARSWSLEGSLKLKNLFGFGDLWDGSLAYGWGQTSEVSAGVSLPRLRGLASPVLARVSLLSKDWLNFSCYNDRALGLSLGLLSSSNHDLAYNITWRSLTDPLQIASRSIRRQLGHSLLSSLKYTFKFERRNSPLRPTRGYALVSTSQIGGLIPDYRSLRFLHQEFHLHYAFPLGFCNAAVNFGVSCGAIFPWGNGFLDIPSSTLEKFFFSGNSSPVCNLGGPMTLLGFKPRGWGPTEQRRRISEHSNNESSDTYSGRDFLGGDLAFTGFADISFDFPMRVLREAGIHGHFFACAGNLSKLTENAFRDFSFKKFLESSRSSAGFGIVVPTKLFRMEVNYCYILKQLEHDRGKTGVQFSFSSPL